MNQQITFQENFTSIIKRRDYKCPCGKTYLSYAALFTHIKQKHSGKAPGKISKPPTLYEKRGRPPIKLINQKKYPDNQVDQNLEADMNLLPAETEQERSWRQHQVDISVNNLVQIIEQMPQQQLNKTHLNQIQVFSQVSVYLNTRMSLKSKAHGNICVADGFLQFAQAVCSKITWSRFQPFYLLFMLFLQFIIDSQNDKRILTDSNMDIFCEYINDFIENHLKDMAEYYSLQNIWIMQKHNSIRVLYQFFHWCMTMQYVTYNVSLALERQIQSESYENHEVYRKDRSMFRPE